MPRISQTLEGDPWTAPEQGTSGPPVPGVVLIFSVDRPVFEVLPLRGGALELGRGEVAGVLIDDRRMSRQHARVTFDGRAWTVLDRESTNGSAVDGEDLTGERAGEGLRVLRTGSSLFLLVADTRPFQRGIMRAGGMRLGPSLQIALESIARTARLGRVVHITGESGSGKELAARTFHDVSSSSGGPFVAVNCATLPGGLAERLLFGARRGAYSGASDAPGYFQSAHGGTLFLDEVAELDLAVQAKLLRALESGEVVPLGATRPERVDVRFCSATHRDLRREVAAGRMREDLFYRIGMPAVTLPPLRARLEEIPWLIDLAVREGGREVVPHVSLVEACLLRRWPGNVRELLAEVRGAAQLAADGGAVLGSHLSPLAGTASSPDAPAPSSAQAAESSRSPASRPSDQAIEEALAAARNNVSAAARALGMHRTQLVRWMTRRKAGAGGGEEGA